MSKSGFGFASLDPEPCIQLSNPFNNGTSSVEGFISRASWVLAGDYTLIRKCEIPTNPLPRSCLEDMPVSIFGLWLECQTPNVLLPHGIHWCVLCLAQKSLNPCPLPVGWFLEKLLAKDRDITKVPPRVHSAIPTQQGCCPAFFLPTHCPACGEPEQILTLLMLPWGTEMEHGKETAWVNKQSRNLTHKEGLEGAVR